MQQVGPGPELWWRADQPPAPRPVLRADAAPAPRHRRFPLAATLLGAVALTILSHPDRRMAALASIERAAELAGFGLQQIAVSGHRFTDDNDIFAALDLDGVRTLLSFDAGAARARIEQLPWIERASIERVVPDGIEVRVSERVAFAVWRSGERSWLIDRTGRKLQAVPADAMPQLLRVAGEGAEREAAALAAALAAFPPIARRVDLAERVGRRRWTLHLAGGTSARLPAEGEGEALARLARLMDAGLDGAEYVDLRASTRVLVRERGAGPAVQGPSQPHPSSRKPSPGPRAGARPQRNWASKLSEERATASPPPLWGRDRVGESLKHQTSGFPPPLTPPHVMSKTCLRHDGEGNPRSIREVRWDSTARPPLASPAPDSDPGLRPG